DDDLRHPKMVKAIDYLSGILLAEPTRDWAIGPMGHGLHALAIYESRITPMLSSSPVPPITYLPLATADLRSAERPGAGEVPDTYPSTDAGPGCEERSSGNAYFDLG